MNFSKLVSCYSFLHKKNKIKKKQKNTSKHKICTNIWTSVQYNLDKLWRNLWNFLFICKISIFNLIYYLLQDNKFYPNYILNRKYYRINHHNLSNLVQWFELYMRRIGKVLIVLEYFLWYISWKQLEQTRDYPANNYLCYINFFLWLFGEEYLSE